MVVDTVRIKLDDGGKGSIVIANGETEIALAATMGIRIFSRPQQLTHVTIRMLANVEFEGPIELSLEQAGKDFPELLALHLAAPAADDREVKFLTAEDWAKAKKHFDRVVGHYEALRGMPGVNVTVALTYVFVPLLERYNAGERSAALYQEMMDVE